MGDYTRKVVGNPPSLATFYSLWKQNRGEFLRYEGDFGSSHLTYAEASRAAAAFAEYLKAQGIGKGERVLFWGENRPEWVVALWGCLLAQVGEGVGDARPQRRQPARPGVPAGQRDGGPQPC